MLPPLDTSAKYCPDTFGKVLSEVRETKTYNGRKFTQKRLGKLLGYSNKRISDWENDLALPENMGIVEVIAQKLHASVMEKNRLKNAYVCDSLKKIGL